MVVGGILRTLLSVPKAHPFAFGVGFSCAKTSFADYLVQTFVEKREEFDYTRNAAFAAFGFAYLGVHYPIL
jgi:hypothetical protein